MPQKPVVGLGGTEHGALQGSFSLPVRMDLGFELGFHKCPPQSFFLKFRMLYKELASRGTLEYSGYHRRSYLKRSRKKDAEVVKSFLLHTIVATCRKTVVNTKARGPCIPSIH